MRSAFGSFLTAFVSVLVLGSIASAQVSVESLEGRTQVGGGGKMVFTNDTTTWEVGATSMHYLQSQFGVGGRVNLSKNGGVSGLNYQIVPAVEYFVPFAERHHVYVQMGLGLGGNTDGKSEVQVAPVVGYRYFATSEIAIGGEFYDTWQKSQSTDKWAGSQTLQGRINFAMFF